MNTINILSNNINNLSNNINILPIDILLTIINNLNHIDINNLSKANKDFNNLIKINKNYIKPTTYINIYTIDILEQVISTFPNAKLNIIHYLFNNMTVKESIELINKYKNNIYRIEPPENIIYTNDFIDFIYSLSDNIEYIDLRGCSELVNSIDELNLIDEPRPIPIKYISKCIIDFSDNRFIKDLECIKNLRLTNCFLNFNRCYLQDISLLKDIIVKDCSIDFTLCKYIDDIDCLKNKSFNNCGLDFNGLGFKTDIIPVLETCTFNDCYINFYNGIRNINICNFNKLSLKDCHICLDTSKGITDLSLLEKTIEECKYIDLSYCYNIEPSDTNIKILKEALKHKKVNIKGCSNVLYLALLQT